jgi:DNA-directed RNA polymerase specialized sigma subunit
MSSFYRVKDIMEVLEVSESKAYQIIQQLNKELREKGYITIASRVPIK